jgi:hypothetical protein
MKQLLTILICGISFQLFSQEDTTNETPIIKPAVEKKFDWEKNFYLSLSTATYLDVVRSPLRMVNVVTGYIPDINDPDINIPIWKEVPYQTVSWALFSIGLEPRINLKTFNENQAFAVSMPISIGVAQSAPARDDIRGTEGFGSFQIPLLAKMYFGHGSTYESEKDYGVSFGAGVEYNKVALLPNKFDEETSEGNKGWIMPVFSLGIHFWRMSNPVEINLKYGAGTPKEYFVDGYGEALRDASQNLTSRTARSSTFKLSFVYLINY